ncbi:MAG: 50S ribosomal protein L21 [Candidatus Absconditabacterales bacterium]|nr:50S ribosomal protein L21 [Candidatus Absconditabacterales bacterium]
MYAVIELKGHQYIVRQGDTIIVDKMEGNKGDKVDIKEVLSTFDEKGENVLVGSPYIQKAKVSVEILETKKGKKINVLKFKRKNRYKRKFGFRPIETVLEIKKIEING